MAPAASSACPPATTSFMCTETDVVVANFGSRQLPLKELDPQVLTIAPRQASTPSDILVAQRRASFGDLDGMYPGGVNDVFIFVRGLIVVRQEPFRPDCDGPKPSTALCSSYSGACVILLHSQRDPAGAGSRQYPRPAGGDRPQYRDRPGHGQR